MSDFKPRAIIKLQNLLSSEKIEQLKSKFISKYNNEDFLGFHKEDGKEKGIIQIQGYNELIKVKFEDELEENLCQATNDLKTEIEQSNIFLNQEEQVNFFNSLLKSFEHSEKENKETFEKFKVCYKPQETIRLYLKEKYNFTIPYKSDIEYRK